MDSEILTTVTAARRAENSCARRRASLRGCASAAFGDGAEQRSPVEFACHPRFFVDPMLGRQRLCRGSRAAFRVACCSYRLSPSELWATMNA